MLPPPSEDNRVADLTRRVKDLESALRASFTTIKGGQGITLAEGGRLVVKGGALVVENAAGDVMFYVGGVNPPLPDGTYQPGLILRREDGTLAMALYDPTPDPASPDGFKQFLALYDRGQRVIVSDDTTAGQGLARPYLGASFYRERFADWPFTTSTTFETLSTAYLYKQHARLFVQAWTASDTAGAVGEVRVLINGNPWQSTATTGFVQATKTFGIAAVDGAHMAPLRIEIQARVVSGGGAVRVEPINLLGVQS